MTVLSFPEDLYSKLIDHLEDPEQVAFMIARRSNEETVFRVDAIRRYETGGFEDRTSSDYEDVIRSEVITWAWQSGGYLVEAHSHGPWFTPACFSRFDLSQLNEWVPHVRWRLGDRPYFAIVTAGNEIDGLAWVDTKNPVAIEKILIDPSYEVATTGESFARIQDG